MMNISTFALQCYIYSKRNEEIELTKVEQCLLDSFEDGSFDEILKILDGLNSLSEFQPPVEISMKSKQEAYDER